MKKSFGRPSIISFVILMFAAAKGSQSGLRRCLGASWNSVSRVHMNDSKADQWAECIRWAGLFPTRSKARCRPAHQECQFRKPAPARPRTAAPFGPAAPKMDDYSPLRTVPSDAIEPIFLRLRLHDIVISQYILNRGIIRGFTDDTAGATRPVLSRKPRLPITLRSRFLCLRFPGGHRPTAIGAVESDWWRTPGPSCGSSTTLREDTSHTFRCDGGHHNHGNSTAGGM